MKSTLFQNKNALITGISSGPPHHPHLSTHYPVASVSTVTSLLSEPHRVERMTTSSSTHRDSQFGVEFEAVTNRFGSGSTGRALMKAHRALTWMDESVRRSLARVDRVPDHSQRAVRTRYTNLSRRVTRSAAALNAMAKRKASPSLPWLEVVALLATIYRLEKELNDANEEHDQLIHQQQEQQQQQSAAENRTHCCML